MGMKKWTDQQKFEAQALRRKGLQTVEIAVKTGIPRGTVAGWLVGISPKNAVDPATGFNFDSFLITISNLLDRVDELQKENKELLRLLNLSEKRGLWSRLGDLITRTEDTRQKDGEI